MVSLKDVSGFPNRQQIIGHCLLSKCSQALEPCFWNEKPMDWVFSAVVVSDPMDFVKKNNNWLKIIDPWASVDK